MVENNLENIKVPEYYKKNNECLHMFINTLRCMDENNGESNKCPYLQYLKKCRKELK